MVPSPDTRLLSPELGRVAGRYELLESLARGGMGEVFLARELASDRKVALKRLLPAAQKRHALFRAEYHTLARLKHPYIIEVYDFGVDGDLPYYTMELLDGYDLRESPQVGVSEGCRILRDVASSLALLHAQRLLHRDVSPRNVRCTSSGLCKLIDFGTMVPFGVPSDLAGTPAFIAPEAWEGAELDQRADLFSLGALAYWLFSRRLPGAARSLDRGRPPRERVPLLRKTGAQVSAELEELVMSLLEHDPSKRPSSAHEVIARLTVIGALAPADGSLAGAQLGSSRFVGQTRALSKAEKLLGRALVCSGGGVLAEGAEGGGKTRFLQELSLLAQTRGFSVVRAFASRSASANSVAQELYRGLRRAAPEALEQVPAAERQALIALDRGEPTLISAEPTTPQSVVWALAAYLRVVARAGPWLLVVDDLDIADEVSVGTMAALAAMAENLPVLVVASAGVGRVSPGARAFASFKERAHRVTLRDLDLKRTRLLVSDLVGRVPHRDRLVDFLFRAAHGNPAITIELCRILLDRGVIRYVDGGFVLPESEIREQLPAHAFSLHLETLSAEALQLAKLIAICRAGASLELCLSASAAPQEAVLSAINELVSRGVLTGSGEQYVFTQEAVRSALRQALSRDELRALHERLAAAFAALAKNSPLSRLEAALHLVQTARELEGARRLAELAPPLIESGVAAQDAIEGLERALEVFERHAAPLSLRLDLRTHLARASYTQDYRLAQRYAEQTITLIRDWLGMPSVEKVRRFLPAPCAGFLCVVIVAFRWLFWPRARRGPGPVTSLQYFARIMMSTMGVHLTALDREGSTRLFEQMWICRELSMIGALDAVHRGAGALLLQTYGREVQLQKRLTDTLALLSKPVPLMQESERRDLSTGLSLSGGIAEAYRLGGSALRRADELELLGTPYAQACAHRVRFTYYVVRGMRERADEHRRELDIHALSGGTTWQVEWFANPIEGMTNARFGDLVVATQALARLERLAGEIAGLVRPRDMLRIGNHVRRGEYARAIELGQEYVAHHPPGSMVGWGTVYAVLAAALNYSQRYDEARALCERAFAALTPEDFEYDHMYGGLVREHAVACAGTGDVERALAISAQYTSRLAAAGEYALLAYALECRARVAQMTSDHALLNDALSAMREASERCGSDAVVEQVAKLIQAFLRATHEGAADQGFDSDFETESTSSVATPPRGIAQTRQHTLLRRVMQRANARAALVLVRADDESMPRVTAAAGEALPMEVIGPLLSPWLQQMAAVAVTDQACTWPLSERGRAFALIALPRRSVRDPHVALVLEHGAEAGEDVPRSMLVRLGERVRSELSTGSHSSDHVSDSSGSHPVR